MRAKRTIYKGYLFASRLECRWVYYLDLLGVPWEYEKEAYDLDGLVYIPDLWLNTLRLWLEIKGEIIDDKRGLLIMEKAKRLAILSGFPVVLTFNDPYDMKCVTFGIRGGVYMDSHFSLCPHCGCFGLMVKAPSGPRFLCPDKASHTETPLTLTTARALHRSFFDTAMAARRKKFGFERRMDRC